MREIRLFEDASYRTLLPLVYTRPVSALRCGILLLQEKVARRYPKAEIGLFCRDYIADYLKGRDSFGVNRSVAGKDGVLFINGRLILQELIPLEGNEEIGVQEETIVYARLSQENAKKLAPETFLEGKLLETLKELKVRKVKAKLVCYQWDLVQANGEEIIRDFELLVGKKGAVHGKVYEGVHLLNPSQIYIGKDSKVKPCVVLDAESGPIYIGENVKIFPNSVVEGPAYIGDGTSLKINAKIYENTSIGPVCKVGGEVEGSILHGYSNKQHDGFLGHAYIGEWCNLGAGTSNSDLKNNYGNVKVYVDGKMVDSGSMGVGLTMGDHSKAGVNTMFNTGTVVGVSSNVFGAGFPPKFIPSFSWGGPAGLTTYKLDKALEVAERVMARRKIKLGTQEEKLYQTIFQFTEEERKATATIGD
ncbi:MAG: GlmU family protein [Candidatus Omnitrophota bacterium]